MPDHRRHIDRQAQQQMDEQYEILPSSEILARLQKLVATYPTFATLTTTQEWFGLPRAGNDADCPFDANYKVHGRGCNNYVLIIHDKEAYPDDSDLKVADEEAAKYYLNLEEGYFNQPNLEGENARSGWKFIPDVFLSGSVHGNERVGPTSLLEMSELMVESAYCESLPRMRFKPSTSSVDKEAIQFWEAELASAQSCRQDLAKNKGVPSPYRQWLARLVSTRRTIVIPTANALGYSRDEREEGNIDPNRDFPFDIPSSKSNECMRTIAGRSINELFRSHLFPIGLTFHGGMEVIGYEWGAPSHLNEVAPDALAQNTIASAYSRYADGFNGHVPYDFGTMNDKVYYVRGGMEDWAFAGSWDTERVVECTPTTFGGYPKEKTVYNNSTLRAFNMLIETSDPKTPSRSELGKRTHPLVSSNGVENGHIARNLRLALLAVDVAQPYLSIRSLEGLEFEDDVVPGVNLRRYNGASYLENSKTVWIPDMTFGSIKISWSVGGAFSIDQTELMFGLSNALPLNLADAEDGTYPSVEALDMMNSNAFRTTTPLQGRSRWHADGPYPTKGDAIDPIFEATIAISSYPVGSTLVVIAKAKVDEDWLQQSNNGVSSGLGPTSHIVSARVNPSYRASNAGKIIRGRRDNWWYSDPIKIIIGSHDGSDSEAQLLADAESKNTPRSVDGDRLIAVHINSRLGYLSDAIDSRNATHSTTPVSEIASQPTTTPTLPLLLGALSISAIVLFVFAAYRRRQQRRRYAARIVSEQEDDMMFDEGYSDDPDEDVENGPRRIL
ncbi:hypothetical protein ACHAWU_005515 [Discostella pseudostelligera]|uniref:Peptidase M14 domain-containing protein n=1 Tax=Discostella pseudostelligera TaxID=259834 RepID=A0ABD3N093_9STRA